MLTFSSTYDIDELVRRHLIPGVDDRSSPELRQDLVRAQSGGFYDYDLSSEFVVRLGELSMEVIGGGPVHAGFVLRSARAHLAEGDGIYHDLLSAGGYGLHLLFTRSGDVVHLNRARGKFSRDADGRLIDGAEAETEETRTLLSNGRSGGDLQIVTDWHAFQDAVNRYCAWLVEDYPREAWWITDVPQYQELVAAHTSET